MKTLFKIRWVVLLAALLAAARTEAQEFRIAEIEFDAGGIAFEYPSEEGYYYRLIRNADLTEVSTAVALGLASPPAALLRDDDPPAGRAFYQIQRLLITAALDTDGDRIDDVYELQRSAILDPLDPFDASEDPDGNGLSHLSEYLAATAPLTRIAATSPRPGEQGVALTRETVLRFSAPLSPAVRLLPDRISARAAGGSLPARLHLAKDRRSVTMFYGEPLPPDAEVTVEVDGGLIFDGYGRGVDADGDGGGPD
ncbi:MAG: hypothetical protein R3F11_20445 [Verrucomicrobiales bacterium]